jgi:hypothetical protein
MNSWELSVRLKVSVEAEAMGNPMVGHWEEGDDGGMREESVVAGVYGDPETGRLCYLALHSMQHHGQEGAGIMSVDNGALKAVNPSHLGVFHTTRLLLLRACARTEFLMRSISGDCKVP